MILRFKIYLLLSCCVSSLFGFDVRVLLHKYNIIDTKQTVCSLSSQYGMMISGIEDPLQGPVSILCTDQNFMVNNIVIPGDTLVLSPTLPVNHEKNIHQFISSWMKEHHDFCYAELLGLTDFYNKFVNDREFRDYAQLYTVLQRCIDGCIYSFIEHVEHPVISYESLTAKAQEQLRNQLKTLLTDAIHLKKASKSLLHRIKSSEKVRNDFFMKILDQILVTFLSNFFLNLPHKIIHQALQEETGCLLFEKHKYLGVFYLIRQADTILLINSLDIDDYLLSVLHSEGWPGWPIEVNKALVIASRTYLVHKILQANKTKRLYHIVNSIQHQTYKGHHRFIQLKQAVDDTRNLFIAYQGQPIDAMFDSCCGGVIPAKIEGVDYKKHPYLARTKSCHHCKKFSIYDWKKELSRLEIAEILQKDHPDITDISDIKVTHRDSAGLVKQVLVVTKKKKFYVSGKKMYSLFPSIKSFCYTIKKRGRNYLFQGRGYGHHMGLCQWGSLGMVQDNWSYSKILQFYYPGTQFMKLSLLR